MIGPHVNLAPCRADRTHDAVKKGGGGSTEEFRDWAKKHFAGMGNGQGLAFLAEASSSPTRARLVEAIKEKLPQASWHVYELVNRDNEMRGAQIAFGKDVRTHADLSAAKVVLSLDADLLGNHPNAQADRKFNRLATDARETVIGSYVNLGPCRAASAFNPRPSATASARSWSTGFGAFPGT